MAFTNFTFKLFFLHFATILYRLTICTTFESCSLNVEPQRVFARVLTEHTCEASENDGLVLVWEDCLGVERTRGDFTCYLRVCGRGFADERFQITWSAINLMRLVELSKCRFCKSWRSPLITALVAHEMLATIAMITIEEA